MVQVYCLLYSGSWPSYHPVLVLCCSSTFQIAPITHLWLGCFQNFHSSCVILHSSLYYFMRLSCLYMNLLVIDLFVNREQAFQKQPYCILVASCHETILFLRCGDSRSYLHFLICNLVWGFSRMELKFFYEAPFSTFLPLWFCIFLNFPIYSSFFCLNQMKDLLIAFYFLI